jgi:hypothetical protein
MLAHSIVGLNKYRVNIADGIYMEYVSSRNAFLLVKQVGLPGGAASGSPKIFTKVLIIETAWR